MKSVISPGVWLLPWLAVLGSRLVAASNSSVTVVSAYWKITSKHSDEEYTRWIRQGVAMSCPMVFFYQHEGMRHRVEAARPAGTHSTVFVHRDLLQAAEKFNYDKTWTHPIHVNNYLLGVVWLDKVFMVADAAASNPFNSEWFVWNGEPVRTGLSGLLLIDRLLIDCLLIDCVLTCRCWQRILSQPSDPSAAVAEPRAAGSPAEGQDHLHGL